jgi:hypothetical protein
MMRMNFGMHKQLIIWKIQHLMDYAEEMNVPEIGFQLKGI